VKQVILLRGVNVGARGPRVAAADLRDFALNLGFTEARTLLQSGNLIVDGGSGGGAELERRLESAAASRLGIAIDFIVRTAAEWRAVIDHNPFAEAAADDPSHLLIFFLKVAPPSAAVDDLRASIVGREVLHVHGTQAYFTYPDGIGESRLTNTVIERRLGVRGTGRNWNTVQKIAALAEA